MLKTHEYLHRLKMNVVTCHSMTKLRTSELLFASHQVVLSQEIDVAKADIIYLLLDTLAASGTLQLVVGWVLLKPDRKSVV